jgi:hypothetical protein
MKKIALLLVITALLLPPAFAHAQQPLTLSNLEVDLWPEYDHPSVLVILHITLDASVSLPTELAVRIPLSAEVNAVAAKDMDGQLLNVNYTQDTTGAWQIVRMQVALTEVQLEYYDNSMKFDGAKRSFLYQWPGDFQVTRAQVIVQQPVEASAMAITPGPVTTQTSSVDGLTYFFKEVGGLNAGQGFELGIDYQKASDRLTAGSMQVAPSEPLPSEAPGTSSSTLYLTIGLVALGLLLIGGGILWYWRSSQQDSAPRRRSRGRGSAREAAPTSETGPGVYCQQCGRRAASGDRFCRTCGSRLRLE